MYNFIAVENLQSVLGKLGWWLTDNKAHVYAGLLMNICNC